MAEPMFNKVMRALGRPPFQRLDDPPAGPPETPGAQAARWMDEIDADRAAHRISDAEYERRKRTIMEWLAKA